MVQLRFCFPLSSGDVQGTVVHPAVIVHVALLELEEPLLEGVAIKRLEKVLWAVQRSQELASDALERLLACRNGGIKIIASAFKARNPANESPEILKRLFPYLQTVFFEVKGSRHLGHCFFESLISLAQPYHGRTQQLQISPKRLHVVPELNGEETVRELHQPACQTRRF